VKEDEESRVLVTEQCGGIDRLGGRHLLHFFGTACVELLD
jgi:hypothetical protein